MPYAQYPSFCVFVLPGNESGGPAGVGSGGDVFLSLKAPIEFQPAAYECIEIENAIPWHKKPHLLLHRSPLPDGFRLNLLQRIRFPAGWQAAALRLRCVKHSFIFVAPD